MKKIILACLLFFVGVLGAKAQFLSTAPTLTATPTDASFGSYGNATPWFMGWDDNYLYIGKTGGNASEALFVYLDIDPNAPSAGGVSGGSNTNGSLATTTDYGVTATLPFRADIRLVITPTYLGYSTRNGSGGWNTEVNITSGNVGTSGGGVRTARYAWNTALIGARPSAFNWLGYAAYSTGIYDVFPTNNTSGNGASPRFYYYQTITNTTNTNTTNPFSTNVRSFETRDAFGYNNTQPSTIFDYTVAANTTTFTNTLTVLNNFHIASGATFTQLGSGGASTLTFGNSSTQTPSLRCDGTLTPNNGSGNDLSIIAASGTTTIAGSAANTAYKIFNLTVNNGATVQAPSSGTVDLGWQFGTITVNTGGILNFVNGSGVVNLTNSGTASSVTLNVTSGGTATFNNFNNSPTTSGTATLANVSANGANALSFNNITNSSTSTIIASSSGTAASAVPMTIRGNLTNSGTFTTLSASNNRFLDITVTGSASILTSSVGISYRGLTIANTGSTSSNSLGVTLAGAGTVTIVTTRLLTVNSGARLILDVNTPLTLSTAPVFTVNGFFRRGVSTITGFSASTFIVNNGGVYEHNFPNGAGTNGTIPNATWNTGSTCTILASNNGNPTGLSQTFHHFTWNNTTQSGNIQFSGNLTTVNGTFTVSSTGTGSIRLVASTDGTAYTATFGALSVTGGTLAIVGGGSAGTRVATINVTNDVTLSGTGIIDFNVIVTAGSSTLNIGGNFSMSGTSAIQKSFGATATVNFNKSSGTQTFTQSAGTISGAINWNVGTGSTTNTLQLSSSVNLGTGALNFNVLSGSSIDFGLFNLTGSSTNFNLNSNATLISALTTATDAQVLTVTGNTTLGSVRTGGTKTYDPAANYIFNGAGTQIAGAAFTSVANLTIAKSSGGLTLSTSTNLDITGNLTLTQGSFNLNTNTVTYSGSSITRTSGTITATNTSLVFTNTNPVSIPVGTFPSLSVLNLTINGAGGVTINSDVNITNSLTLTSGTLTVGAVTLGFATSIASVARTSGNINASGASSIVSFTNTSPLTLPNDLFTGSIATLTINGAGGITLGSAITVATALNLTSGNIDLSTFNLTINSSASISGGSASSYIITSNTGRVLRSIANGGGTFIFPIGRNTSNYNPLTITNAGGNTAVYTVGAANTTYSPSTDGANAQWSIAASASTTSTFAFEWATADAGATLSASPASGRALQYNGSTWDNRGGSTAGTPNVTTITGITDLTNPTWTVALPPAVPDIAISANAPAAGNIVTASTNNIIYGKQIVVTTANTTLTGVTVNTTGTDTYAASAATDLTNFKLWINTTNSLSGATQLGSTITNAPTLGGALAFTSGSNLPFSVTTATGTYYLFVTCDVASGAVPGRLITISSTAFSNINFGSGNKTGTDPIAAGNAQTIISAPTVTTNAASSVATTSVVFNGTVNANANSTVASFDYGTTISYGTNIVADESPVTGTSNTAISKTITGLGTNTLYNYRAKGVNDAGTTNGSNATFTTISNAPTVGTGDNATAVGFRANWTAPTNDGSEAITYTVEVDDDNTFASVDASQTGISGTNFTFTTLSSGVTYYYRVRAVNAGGNSAWSAVSAGIATTSSTVATVTTAAISSITVNSASGGGEVVIDGGDPVTERGIVYNTAGTPTTADTKIINGSGVGTFTANLTSLSSNTTYYVRAYAINGVGTAYGSEVNFTTLAAEPTTQSTVAFGTRTNTSLVMNFTGGNGGRRVVFVKQGSGVDYTPTDAVAPSGINAVFGAGTQFGTGNYAVYDGTGTTVTVTGLTKNTTYHIAVYEYTNNSVSSPNYFATAGTGNATTYNPTIATTGSISAFGNVITGTNSSSQSYTVEGTELAGSITITAPTGFAISLDDVDFSVNPIILAKNGSDAVPSTTIYVRFSPASANGATGSLNITHTSTDATTQNVAVSGNALAVEPTTVGTISFGTVTTTSIVVNLPTVGDGARRLILVKSGSAVDATPTDANSYTANAVFASGDQIGSGNYIIYNGTGSGNSLVTLTGLSKNVTYHFAVFEYNEGTGTSQNYYGTAATANQTTANESASTDAFRSAQTGNWSDNTTWESFSAGSWIVATATPTNSASTITIQNGHTVTITTSVSTDETTINSGGQITVNSGQTLTIADGTGADITVNGTLRNVGTLTLTGTMVLNNQAMYDHAFSGATLSLPTMANITWNTGSTLKISGTFSTAGAASAGTIRTTGTLANVLIDCNFSNIDAYMFLASTGTLGIDTLTIANTGNGEVVSSNNFNAVTCNTYIQTGGLFYASRSAGNNFRSFAVTGNSSITGGAFHIINGSSSGNGTVFSVGGNLTVGASGILTNSGTAGYGTLTFTGSSAQTWSNAGTFSITGSIGTGINVSGAGGVTLNDNISLSIGGTVQLTGGDLTIASGKTLSFGTGTTACTISASRTLTVNGTLARTGNGTFTVTGSLVFSSTGKYQHNHNAGSVPTATWNTGSICEFTGITTTQPSSGLGQSFHHVYWNCASQSATVNLASGLTTVNGNFEIQNTNANILRLSSSTLTLNVLGNMVISGTNSTVQASSSGNSATINVSGNYTIGSSATSSTAGSAYNIRVGGNWSNSGTFTSTNSTVTFNGTGTQTITKSGGETFNSLTVNKATGALQLVNGVTVANTLTLTNGSIDLNANTLTLNSGSAAQSIAGSGSNSFTINSGVPGGIVSTTGSGSHTITLSGFGTTPSNGLVIGSNTTLQLNNNAIVNCGGNGTSTSMLTIANVLQINGTTASNIASGTAPFYTSASTLLYSVTYNPFQEWLAGTALTTPGVPQNVIINGSGITVTMPTTDRSVLGNLTITNGTFALNGTSGNLSVGGNWLRQNSNTSVFTHNGRTVTFNGSTAQTIQVTGSGTNTATFGGFAINNTLGGVSLLSPVDVSTTLTLTNGILTTTSTNILSMLNTTSGSITGGSTTSFINGPMNRTLAANLAGGSNTFNFPVGNGTTYLPLTLINPTTGATGPVLQVTASNGDSGGNVTGSTTLTSLSTTEYWEFSVNSGNFTNGAVNITRQTALAGLNTIARSTTLAGTYVKIGGTAGGTTITGDANAIGAILASNSNYFVMAVAIPAPSITSFTPTNGYSASTVVITGTNFTNTSAVTIGGTAVTSFVVDLATQITAVVGSGTTGTIAITSPAGTGTSASNFTFNGYITANDGDWNTPSTWFGGVVPVANTDITIDKLITVNSINPLAVNNLTIASGSSSSLTVSSGRTVTINSGNTLTNSSSNASLGAGTIAFAGSGTVSGTVTFNNVTIAGGVNFGSASTIGTNGSLQLNSGGFVTTNAPEYSSTATLVYNNTGSFNRTLEWSATSGKGYPGNVLIQNGTTVSTQALSGDIGVANHLTLGTTGSAGSLSMSNAANKIIVGGNVQIGGTTGTSTLTLSSASGGDIKVGGNWTRNANGAFTSNVRAIFFTGTGINEISGNGGESVGYLVMEKAGGSVKLLSNLTITADNAGTALSIPSTASFDLNGNTLSFNGSNQSLILADGGVVNFTGAANSTIEISNAIKTVSTSNSGTVVFGNNVLISASTGINFGSGLSTVNGTFRINAGGYVQSNAPVYGPTSTLQYNTGTVYGRFIEWNTNSGAGYPANVQLSNSTTLNYPNTGNGGLDPFTTNLSIAGNLTIDNGSALYLGYGDNGNKSGALTVAGNVTLNGNLGLGNASGGDLYVGGNWTRAAASADFFPNGRLLIFNGTGAQSISRTGGETFSNIIVVNKASGVLTANNNITFQNDLTLTSGTINDGGNTLTLNGNIVNTGSHASTGSGKIIMNGTSKTISGATLGNIEIASTTISLSGNPTINGVLTLTNSLDLASSSRTLNLSNTSVVEAGTNQLIGTGTVNINGVFKTAKVEGFSGASSSIPSATVNLDALSTIEYAAAIAQTITARADYKNVTLTGSSIKTLAGNTSVAGTLLLTNSTDIASISNSTLTLSGTISGSGLLRGGSTSNLSIGGTGALGTLLFDQTTDGTTNILNNVVVNRSSGTLSLGNKLVVTNVYTPTSGVLTTNNHLHIRSTASNTARIAAGSSGGGYISGDVTVERYMSASSNRAWRLLTPGVTTSTNINANWQEGKVNTTTNTNVPADVAGYGVHITGTGGNSNGFDVTQTNAASLYSFNQATQNWALITNTNVNTLDAKQGYLLFVRGNRDNITPINTTTGSSNVTLRAKGTLLQGTQTFSGLATANNFSLVTNPFASPIDWANIYTGANTTNFENSVTIWDPNVNTRGGFVTVRNDNVTGGGVTNLTTSLQSGQAFFIQTKTGIVGNPSFVIEEAHKATTNNLDVFRTNTPLEKLKIQLQYTASNVQRIADGVVALFSNTYSNAVDGNDAEQIANWDEDIALTRNGKDLSIESRSTITANDTLFLKIANLRAAQVNYRWVIEPEQLNAAGLTAFLQDNFTNTTTPISLTAATTINFTVSSNAASTAANRFRIVFRNNAALPVTITQIKAQQKGNNVQVLWNTVNEQNIQHYEVEKSTNAQQFSKIATVAAKTVSSSNEYSMVDASVPSGTYYYRLKIVEKNGSYNYSKVVRFTIGKGNVNTVSIYPNPIKGNIINLQLNNVEKGQYTIKVINYAGQVVYQSNVQHLGGSATEQIVLSKALASGQYQLEMSNEKGIRIVQTIMKE